MAAIDREKVRAAVRRLGPDDVFFLLDEALDLLSPTQLATLTKDVIHPSSLVDDGAPPKTLLEQVNAFKKASLAGDYFDAFNVNADNCTDLSRGTQCWIADCRRLLKRACAEDSTLSPPDLLTCFEILVALVDRIDGSCAEEEPMLFFGDEGGSWLLGIDWDRVFLAWLTTAAKVMSPQTFAEYVLALVKRRPLPTHDKLLTAGKRAASPAQLKSLEELLQSN